MGCSVEGRFGGGVPRGGGVAGRRQLCGEHSFLLNTNKAAAPHSGREEKGIAFLRELAGEKREMRLLGETPWFSGPAGWGCGMGTKQPLPLPGILPWSQVG